VENCQFCQYRLQRPAPSVFGGGDEVYHLPKAGERTRSLAQCVTAGRNSLLGSVELWRQFA